MAENTNSAESASLTDAEATTTPKLPEEEHHKKLAAKNPTIIRIKLILSFIAFILSLIIIASIIWLLYVRDYNCEYLLKLHKLHYAIVIGLIVAFILSNLAVFLFIKSKFPMPAVFVLMTPFILMLIVGLALVGAYRMESQSIPASPAWLNTKILLDDDSWNTIKSCIYDKKVCQSLASRSYIMKPYDFTYSKLSPIESGCCRPPASCDMEFVNATYWRKGEGGDDSSDPYDSDCDLWTNNGAILCYNCHACKQGFQTTIQGKWITLGTFLVAIATLLLVVHLLLFVISMWERYGG